MNDNENLDIPQDKKSLKEQKEQKQKKEPQLFGTISGVFIPTLLTILGVIMYLREGWVVGNAGLGGAWLIILLSFGITSFTGLSLSSITTNIRIGAGGAFSIISQSLGLEVGGSVGVPLYLAQALAVAMYIFGFRAGWTWIFPDHSPLLVDFAVFGLLFIIAFISAGFAFKIQYVIFAVIIGSLISVAVSAFSGSMQHSVQWWGQFPGSPETGFGGMTFWAVFAVFFPASTGIMAGANMSGELKNPRRSIPLGTLSAIGISLIIYLALAYWLVRSASNEELLNNYTIMVDLAAWGPAVLCGLLGATFSSALSSLIGAPRILQALGSRDILPAGKWFATRTKKGEPRNALLLTAAIVFAALLLRNLNAIAPLITMFFLITYAMINLVVVIEQSLRLVSFRPLFKIPRLISFLGAFGCLAVMFIINPVFSGVALFIVLAIHAYLIRKHLRAPFGDVRSGLLVAVAEWAAKKVESLTPSREKTWKANLLIPAEQPERIEGLFDFIRDLSYPKGFLKLVGLTGKEQEAVLQEKMADLAETFQNEGIFASWTVITAASFGENLKAGIETFAGTFFKPNGLFLTMPEGKDRKEEIENILDICRDNRIGALILHQDPEKEMREKKAINLWFSNTGPDWDLEDDLGDQDLVLLSGYKLKLNWNGRLSLIAETNEQAENSKARNYLELVTETARIPNAEIYTLSSDNQEGIPDCDLNIFPITETTNFDEMQDKIKFVKTACLFTLDSGNENALA